jgi:dTDP-4-amino-4,6-dideoxygalactose transaminase
MIHGPLARYRLYGRTRDYATLALTVAQKGEGEADPVRALEETAAQFFGARHAIAVPQNRVGIYLAVRALVRPGQRVVLSPYTLSDVINMVIVAGGEPVFADVERETCNIDPDQIEALIDNRTGAVIVTHLHGLLCDMERIDAICRKHGVALIEDAAQACGAQLGGRRAGTFGDAGVLSFGMYKNVNSFYGGLVLTPDDEVARKIREWLAAYPLHGAWAVLTKAAKAAMADLATHPSLFRYFVYWIFRYAYLNDIEALNRQVRIEIEPALKTSFPEAYARRMRPAQARIVTDQLSEVDRLNDLRIETARRYDAGFHELNSIIRPPLLVDRSHSYLHYPIQVPNREKLTRDVVRNGRDIAIQHLRNCADLPCFSRWYRDCPNARAVAESVVLLPTYPGYGGSEVDATIAAICDHLRA